MKKSSCAPAAGKRIFSRVGLNCVSMKVRVNMSELRRDIRGKTAEGKEWGRGEMLMRSRRAGAHSQIRHDIGADTKPRSVAAEISAG